MNSYLDLISISAKVRKKQNKMTRICIILAVFLVTAIFGMADMEIRSRQLQEIKAAGNWHVLYSGIDEKAVKMIAARPEVQSSGWWYDSPGKKNAYTINGRSVSLSGLDKAVFEDTFPTKVVEGEYPVEKNEAVLTENAKVGLGIKVGNSIILERDGMQPLQIRITGFIGGTSNILKEDTYEVLFTAQGFQASVPTDLYTSQYIVQFSKYCNMQKVITNITQQLHLTDDQVLQNGNLLGALGQSNNSYLLMLYSVAGILFIIVLLAGILMITSSLNSNVMQRTAFFGMIRCLGATKKQIMHFVRKEGFYWCRTAIPSGIGLGIVSVWTLCILLKLLVPGYFSEIPSFGISWISIIFGIAVGVLTVLIAASAPAKRAANVSPIAAVSGNAHPTRFIRTTKNTDFYKIDIELGIQHAKMSKKNFWLMTCSFALSIVLFLCFSTTVNFMHHAVTPLKPWTPDLSFVSRDNNCSIENSLVDKLQRNPNIKRVYARMLAYHVPVTTAGQDKLINLISYDDIQFLWAKENLLEGSIEEVSTGEKVLLVYDGDNGMQVGDTMVIGALGSKRKISVAGVLSSSPFSHENGIVTVFCSENTFRQLTGNHNYTVIDIQLTRNATNEEVNEIRSVAGSNIDFSDRRLNNQEARGAYLSYGLFIYGFMIIIALITIFNIVNSVAMSVSARMKQYGILRAIGMSNHQLVAMVVAETITYAFCGSITGCIIGLPLQRILFQKMITSHWGESWSISFPLIGIIVSTVIIASILAVYGPVKRIHHMSIVDTINA